MKPLLRYVLEVFLRILVYLGGARTSVDTQKIRHQEVVDYIKSLNLSLSAKILDIGCGNGEILNRLHTLGYKNLNGCDWIEPLATTKYLYEQIDLNNEFLNKYKDEVFDIIICSDVLEHLENPALTLREMSRITNRDSNIVITIPNAWNLQERILFFLNANSSRYKSERNSAKHGHISFFTTEIIESLLDRANLHVSEYVYGENFFLGYTLKIPKNILTSYNVLIACSKKIKKS